MIPFVSSFDFFVAVGVVTALLGLVAGIFRLARAQAAPRPTAPAEPGPAEAEPAAVGVTA